MKSIQIKSWPETINYNSALVSPISLSKKDGDINIDFSNCKEVNSTGITVFLIKILKLLQNDNIIGWNFESPLDTRILIKIMNFGFFEIINRYKPNNSIFIENNFDFSEDFVSKEKKNQCISFPIKHVEFSKNELNRRNELIHFRKYLYDNLYYLTEKYSFNITQFVLILSEIAKNSADHTMGDAFFGLDIIENVGGCTLHFAFGDLGVGLKQNFQKYLPESILKQRGKHLSLYELYYYALQDGVSTKPTKMNNGHGMSIIRMGSKNVNLDLSVFDAKSRAVISDIDKLTHAEIRKHFYNIGTETDFVYYGKLMLMDKTL